MLDRRLTARREIPRVRAHARRPGVESLRCELRYDPLRPPAGTQREAPAPALGPASFYPYEADSFRCSRVANDKKGGSRKATRRKRKVCCGSAGRKALPGAAQALRVDDSEHSRSLLPPLGVPREKRSTEVCFCRGTQDRGEGRREGEGPTRRMSPELISTSAHGRGRSSCEGVLRLSVGERNKASPYEPWADLAPVENASERRSFMGTLPNDPSSSPVTLAVCSFARLRASIPADVAREHAVDADCRPAGLAAAG